MRGRALSGESKRVWTPADSCEFCRRGDESVSRVYRSKWPSRMLHNYIEGNSLIWAAERNNGVSPLTLLLHQRPF